ncbi:MAG TPA: hypothetical protein VN038_29440, partial [Dyadobacter sp.]|nr:hypothetical protein [Dyadobacter sp.]
MMLSYFLTGSLRDHDNDFELTIRQNGADVHNPEYILRLEDLTSPEKLCWESLPAGFADALSGLSDFAGRKTHPLLWQKCHLFTCGCPDRPTAPGVHLPKCARTFIASYESISA